jgi:hypothetical protein
MITPVAPAPWALSTFTPLPQVPAWINAMRPGTKPVKSDALQPLAELGVGVGGMTMPPTGCRSAVALAPVLFAAVHSVMSVKVCAVGEISLNAGTPTKLK